ncbi:CGNR zinc finger domain-containing protein [Agromyces sp. NPDC049794]|uniref:CGNR zinc finger domain-containing protein n=1 Tax=unclassified Agromyces TaxID=2639701 RepID=UPI0034074430
MLAKDAEQPGGRAPAPGRLAVVQGFVNSIDIEADELDEFATVRSMARWFQSVGLAQTGLHESDRAVAIGLREAIRDMVDVRDHPTHPVAHEFAAVVDDLELKVVVLGGIPTIVGTTPIGRALAPIVDAVRLSMDDGTWSRLKVCARDRCRWLFYDHSKNHASRWCASSVCGSREKSRRAYRRRKSIAAPHQPQ